ncbi:sensor domain CHASE-containing protein [Roseivivax lentus]|uniref:histidine kinase n=1 Tax=Roseivivax lentus TaxID=633194 RepID=A0A1N7P6H4_9RHOB|nr:PAS-domain containing protein [Roseivivax lentus]SIT06148.1 sensor domain CHASE-containing protein [Roseivivax lentus]
MLKKRSSLPRHTTIAISILIAVCVASLFVVDKSLSYDKATSRLEVEAQAQRLADQIEANIEGLAFIARGVATAVARDTDISDEVFAKIAARFSADAVGLDDGIEILNIAAAPDLVVRHVYPRGPNDSVIGIDYRNLPDQYPGVLTAMASRKPVIAGPVDLAQGGRGLIVRVGVDDLITNSPWGVVSIVARIDDAFDAVADVATASGLDFAVIGDPVTGRPSVFGASDLLPSAAIEVPVEALDQKWTLTAAPSVGWPTSASDTASIWALFAGLGAFVFFVYILLDRFHAARRRAEDRLQDSINAIDDGFAIYDANDRFLTSNDAYRNYYPLSAEKMTPGTSFADIIRFGVDRGEYLDAIGREDAWFEERMRRHRTLDGATVQRLTDGRWLKVSEKLLADGSTVGFRVDITELVQARQAAEAANHAKSIFLDQMSHELRTPLSVLLGYAAFLENPQNLGSYKGLPEDVSKESLSPFVEDIARTGNRIGASGRQLLGLLDRILDISDIEAGGNAAPVTDLCLEGLLSPLVQGRTVLGEPIARVMPDYARLSVQGSANELSRALNAVLRHISHAYPAPDLSVDLREEDELLVLVFEVTGPRYPNVLPGTVFGDRFTLDCGSAEGDDPGLDLVIADRLARKGGAALRYRRVGSETDRIEFVLTRTAYRARTSDAA